MESPESPRFFDLSTVTRRIDELLRPAYARTFWVKAELSSGRERGGSFFAELVESRAGRVVAKLRCVIWTDQLERVRRKFQAAGLELSLADGTVVGVHCRLGYHPQHGLSLSVLDMDPAVALGELELRRRRILLALDRDGLLERNARLPVPLLPLRVGLITSAGSAAYNDFTRTLLASPYAFRIWLADTTVQGPEAEAGVAAALGRLEVMALDAIAIVRGGGSKTDLAWLDSEALARRVAGCRLPVWTGIGHEIDRGVLDAVAGRAFKTPTAVAEELLGRAENLDRRLEEAVRRLRGHWTMRVEGDTRLLAHARTGLRQGTRKLLDLRREQLRGGARALHARVEGRLGGEHGRVGTLRQSLRGDARRRLRDARGELTRTVGELRRAAERGVGRAGERVQRARDRLRPEALARRIAVERAGLERSAQLLRASDPARALERGYSLTFAADGRLLRSVAELEPDQTLLTHLADGQFESRVRKITTEEDSDDA